MAIQTSTLRPGLLVSLKSSVVGNVTYRKQTIEADHYTGDGMKKARWETERTIIDPVEHELAGQVRTKARNAISKVCAGSAFGLLCPESDADKLEAAIIEARKLADEFNAGAKLTRIHVYVITGRIAPDDVEAVRAINSEIRDLMSAMADGIDRLDVKAVREAADRAKSVGVMLSPDMQARVQIAVEQARSAARKIVKAGETAAQEIDTAAMRKITEMRTAFLDLDGQQEIAAPVVDQRAIDLAPAQDEYLRGVMNRAPNTPAIELAE